jgi:serine/threonine protein kinase
LDPVVSVIHNGGKIAQVCWGLIQGVAYLHKAFIAHRDIKPINLVVDMNFSLKIIDFDVSMQVENEDVVVDGQCGTKGWMAPEMEENSRYSPIKADRWSTGQVLLHLLDKSRKEDKVLRRIAKDLTAHNPEWRPSMLQVVSDAAKITVERKAARSLQHTMQVDRENVMPATKKLKVSAPDRAFGFFNNMRT